MKTLGKQGPAKSTAGVVSVVGLVLVWGIVWANLPSRDVLLSPQSPLNTAATAPVQELDLTIPGVPAGSSPLRVPPAVSIGSTPDSSRDTAESRRARQIAEMKCDAEVQQLCPDSLSSENRRQCAAQRMKQLPPACQHIVRRHLVRWREADSYRFACGEDVARVCAGVEAGEGRILECLQEHAQEISEPCYQSLPKGQLLLRN